MLEGREKMAGAAGRVGVPMGKAPARREMGSAADIS